jgi:hypothetical protein
MFLLSERSTPRHFVEVAFDTDISRSVPALPHPRSPRQGKTVGKQLRQGAGVARPRRLGFGFGRRLFGLSRALVIRDVG